MAAKPPKDCSEPWLGSKEENRRAYRRRTIAQVSFLERSVEIEPAAVTNVSKDGLYIDTERPLAVGGGLHFTLRLPTDLSRIQRCGNRGPY